MHSSSHAALESGFGRIQWDGVPRFLHYAARRAKVQRGRKESGRSGRNDKSALGAGGTKSNFGEVARFVEVEILWAANGAALRMTTYPTVRNTCRIVVREKWGLGLDQAREFARVIVETGEDAGEVAHAEVFGENLADDCCGNRSRRRPRP